MVITILAVGTSENLQLFHNSRFNCAPPAPLKFDFRHVEFLPNSLLEVSFKRFLESLKPWLELDGHESLKNNEY